jgi:5-methyltetrahydrofolate--homocysteine methyltransferase
MALQNGLSAAIINPNSEAMMRSYLSYMTLCDLDPQCSRYIKVYSGQVATLGDTRKAGVVPGSGNNAGDDISLGESIKKGLRDRAHAAVLELIKDKEPLSIINEEMIPALDQVGKGFEKGTVFLPQLLMSAEAAKAAFEVIKEQLAKSGIVEGKKGTVILATVRGDIHDIGKNIVKVLLENYSYDVIDLGKDVPPELIVKTAVEKDVKLVGLSALMTTTVPSMEETIRQLQKESPDTKVMVGGAVLTEDYAKTIGANQYCKDAMASVNYAEGVFKVK